MTRWLAVILLLCAPVAAQQAPIPVADEISGNPYVIQKKWVIGGVGNWGYLALDPIARQLFVTHQTSVEVVDIDSGNIAGEISGFQEARSVILDHSGQYGYVSDGRAEQITVFDRRSLRVEGTISILCAARSMVLSPDQGVLLAICGSPIPAPPLESLPKIGTTRQRQFVPDSYAKGDSWIVVIDTDTRKVLVSLLVAGDLRMAQTGLDGSVYVTVGPAQRDCDRFSGMYCGNYTNKGVARVDVQALVRDARDAMAEREKSSELGELPAPRWDTDRRERSYLSIFPVDSNCETPKGLAVDSHNARLFVACDNQILLVLDSFQGRILYKLTVGPGTDSIAYDPDRGLIFTANGGGYGSLSVIRRHETDSYAVIQNLPTMERARTMALDSSTGLVYLVTDLHGATLSNPPVNGIGTLKMDPVAGSFQVLVIGN